MGNRKENCSKKRFVFIILFLLLIALCFHACKFEYYETNHIEDYGVIVGTNNKIAHKYIFSFFPEQIEPYFSDIRYHYKAFSLDAVGCEVYLEFTIQDENQFMQYLEQLNISENNTVVFSSDPSFREFAYNKQYFSADPSDQPGNWSIQHATIRKIFYSMDQQKIIFWAYLVHDGGGTHFKDLRYFFDLYDITPDEYKID